MAKEYESDPMQRSHHDTWMQIALTEARKAQSQGEVPVGALIIDEGNQILARNHNQCIQLSDPTGHAEILALRAAAARIRNYRLLNTTLYVTVEPCVMCMGAIIHARIANIVFGAPDPKWGAAGSIYDFARNPRLNHQPVIISGVCEEACRTLIQNFFRNRRKGK
jgi:tRNA(adenine34) deaminase